jgi:hypothetical protein
MKNTSSFALGLAWAAALALAAPLSAAAPRAKKPRASAAKQHKKKAEPAPEAAPAEETPAPPPEPTPTLPPTTSPEAPPAPESSAKPELSPEAPSQPALADEQPSPDEVALGRREAKRLALGRSLVAVWVGAGVANRRFRYSDPVGYELAPYRLPVAPMADFGVEAYPAASSDVPALRDLGIVAHVSRGFAFDSTTPQGVTLETSWTRFGGELRQRLIFPSAHRLELGVSIGADASYFGMRAKSPVPALLPASRTVALRFGVDARQRAFWRVSALAGFGYLLTTTRGEIYDNFREPRVQGVDADLGLAVELGSGFEARLSGRYTRYFASFNPVLGDRYVAGGALDEQLQGGLGVRYAH